MTNGNDSGLMIIGFVVMGAVALGLLWGIASVAWLVFGRSVAPRFLYPIESKLLQWLQDRATARAFGTSVDVVRVRRKADTRSD